MTDTTNTYAMNSETEQETESMATEEAKAGNMTEFEKAKEEKKKKEESSLNYTHYFNKPVEILGKKYTSLTFYFERLIGEDIEAIEDELQDQNKFVLTPETSSSFQCILAAKAAGVPSDEIRRLPVYDYMKIKNKARNFLINAG